MRGLTKIAATAAAALYLAIASTVASAAEIVLVTTAAVEQISVGALPADLQTTIIYATGIAPAAKAGDAARALAKFIMAPDAAPVVRKNGMDPA